MNGWLGVNLFFVLSGFLLTQQLLRAVELQPLIGAAIQFWRRRAYRILPCYLIVLFVLWIAPSITLGLGALDAEQLAAHLLFLQDYFASDFFIPSWSLATEEKFYLLLPFGAFLLKRLSRRTAGVIFIGLSLMVLAERTIILSPPSPIDYSLFFWRVRAPFHLAVDGLLLGMAVGVFFDRKNIIIQPIYHLYLLFFSCSIIVALLMATDWLTYSFLASSTIIWMFSGLTAIAIYSGCSLEFHKKIKSRLIISSFFAKISYPLYLVHFSFVYFSLNISRDLLKADSIWLSPAFWTIYLGSAVAAAYLLHVVVEAPLLKLRDSVTRTNIC